MTDLRELAERVEALEGPSRKVDDEIATALFEDKQWTCIEGLSDEDGGMWMFRYPDGSIGSSLRFTASLDAARTLVGNNHWRVEDHPMAGPSALVGDDEQGYAATPALALTATALRSIASQKEMG